METVRARRSRARCIRSAHGGHVHAQAVAVAQHRFGIGDARSQFAQAVCVEIELVHQFDPGLIDEIGLVAQIAVVEQIVRLPQHDMAQVALIGKRLPRAAQIETPIDAHEVGGALQHLVRQVLRIRVALAAAKHDRYDVHPHEAGNAFGHRVLRISYRGAGHDVAQIGDARFPGGKEQAVERLADRIRSMYAIPRTCMAGIIGQTDDRDVHTFQIGQAVAEVEHRVVADAVRFPIRSGSAEGFRRGEVDADIHGPRRRSAGADRYERRSRPRCSHGCVEGESGLTCYLWTRMDLYGYRSSICVQTGPYRVTWQ